MTHPRHVTSLPSFAQLQISWKSPSTTIMLITPPMVLRACDVAPWVAFKLLCVRKMDGMIHGFSQNAPAVYLAIRRFSSWNVFLKTQCLSIVGNFPHIPHWGMGEKMSFPNMSSLSLWWGCPQSCPCSWVLGFEKQLQWSHYGLMELQGTMYRKLSALWFSSYRFLGRLKVCEHLPFTFKAQGSVNLDSA